MAEDHTVSHQEFEIWHCEDCQLRFTQNIPAENEIGAFYQSEEYISHTNTSKGLINSLYQKVRNYTLGQKLNLIRKASGKKTGNILDIGCGTGDFLNTMKMANWEVIGLEPDEGARQLALENFGIEVYEREHLFELKEASYDVITMWHVLEHVHRLHEYLNTIQRLLKPGGTLIIAVPNYQSTDADAYKAFWAAYDVPRHLYHFSPASMKRLLEKHSFSLDRMKLMPFDSFYVSMLSDKYKYGGLRLISSFWTGFKSWLKASGKVERSSSIIYLSKKNA